MRKPSLVDKPLNPNPKHMLLTNSSASTGWLATKIFTTKILPCKLVILFSFNNYQSGCYSSGSKQQGQVFILKHKGPTCKDYCFYSKNWPIRQTAVLISSRSMTSCILLEAFWKKMSDSPPVNGNQSNHSHDITHYIVSVIFSNVGVC